MGGIFSHRPHNGNGHEDSTSMPPSSIDKEVQLFISEMGAGPEPDPDKYMNPFQLGERHRDYSLARSSYEAEGLSKNIENLLYETLNERLGETLDATFKDKKEEVKRSAIWILAMIALRGGIEYKKFDNFGDAQYSLGLNHGDLRPTNNNIANALYGLIGAGYVAQGKSVDGKPTLIATSKLDQYLQQKSPISQ